MEYKRPVFARELSDKEKIAALRKLLEERRKLLTPEMMKERLMRVGILDENGEPAAWVTDSNSGFLRD